MKKWIFIIGVIFAVVVVAFGTWLLYTKYKPTYTAEDFGIIRVTSPIDYNNNGTDDYTDILLGARKDAKNKPQYKSQYYQGRLPSRGRRSMHRCRVESFLQCRL